MEELDIIDYLIYKHDAFIERMSQSEKGEEYLNNAWRLNQTAPDKESLRKQFNNKGG